MTHAHICRHCGINTNAVDANWNCPNCEKAIAAFTPMTSRTPVEVGARVVSTNGSGMISGTIVKTWRTGKNVRVRWDNSRHSFLTAKEGLSIA